MDFHPLDKLLEVRNEQRRRGWTQFRHQRRAKQEKQAEIRPKKEGFTDWTFEQVTSHDNNSSVDMLWRQLVASCDNSVQVQQFSSAPQAVGSRNKCLDSSESFDFVHFRVPFHPFSSIVHVPVGSLQRGAKEDTRFRLGYSKQLLKSAFCSVGFVAQVQRSEWHEGSWEHHVPQQSTWSQPEPKLRGIHSQRQAKVRSESSSVKRCRHGHWILVAYSEA